MTSAESDNDRKRLVRETMRRPEVKERIAAAMRRQRAVRFLLETVGGVDFDALSATSADNEDGEDAEAAVSAEVGADQTESAAPEPVAAEGEQQEPVAAEQPATASANTPGETSA